MPSNSARAGCLPSLCQSLIPAAPVRPLCTRNNPSDTSTFVWLYYPCTSRAVYQTYNTFAKRSGLSLGLLFASLTLIEQSATLSLIFPRHTALALLSEMDSSPIRTQDSVDDVKLSILFSGICASCIKELRDRHDGLLDRTIRPRLSLTFRLFA